MLPNFSNAGIIFILGTESSLINIAQILVMKRLNCLELFMGERGFKALNALERIWKMVEP
ncbi:MAG: hypothetical protein CMJ81_00650 [Planctomycetaceae bacterium]|jgi:hypothetical protein|nr:hypothetical protein [Planctomycetaceae bacterium]MBP63944.1 hypothetical protein [Planctomycetaceae bacterium]